MGRAVLTITYDDETSLTSVTGPLDQRTLCYGMLECARDAIKDRHDAAAQAKKVVPASAGDILALNQREH